MSAFAGAALPLPAREAAGVASGARVARPRLRVRPSPRTDPASRLAGASVSPARRRPRAPASEKTVGEAVTYSFDVAGNASATASRASGPPPWRRSPPSATVSGTPSDATPVVDPRSVDADAVVAEVLATIADTDSGKTVTPEQRRATDANIALLEAVGATQTPNALTNPLIFGDYDVSYVSTGGKQIGNPAGGRFRGGLGAALFRTVGLEQNLYQPDVVVNRVAFLVFGLIPGEVVLRGTFAPVEIEEEPPRKPPPRARAESDDAAGKSSN